MKNYKYPLLYGLCSRRRHLARAIGITPRRLQLKQRPESKSDFTGEEMRRASEYLKEPAERIFGKEEKGGYMGILTERGKYVPEEEALHYAMERCGIAPSSQREPDAEFITWFKEWFYSGNWLTQEEYDELFVGNKEVL